MGVESGLGSTDNHRCVWPHCAQTFHKSKIGVDYAKNLRDTAKFDLRVVVNNHDSYFYGHRKLGEILVFGHHIGHQKIFIWSPFWTPDGHRALFADLVKFWK